MEGFGGAITFGVSFKFGGGGNLFTSPAQQFAQNVQTFIIYSHPNSYQSLQINGRLRPFKDPYSKGLHEKNGH